MFDWTDMVVRHGAGISEFFVGWFVLAVVIGFGYSLVCRAVDRRAVREREMRQLLYMVGRERREAQLAAMLANADALVAEVQDARAMRRILRDVRRAPLVAVEDIDRIAG